MDLRQVLPAGLVLDGKYRIERVIGAGGFGITYAAHDIGLNTTIALKEYYPAELGMRDATMSIRPKSNNDRELFDRLRSSFVEEARTLAKFRHRSIVRVLSVFEAHGTAYMAMEFEDGRSLKAWMRELGRLPVQAEIDGIFYPLLDALEALHEAHFLHRDIAPDNIIIRPDGSPVLLDFGAARRVAATERSSQMTGLIKLGYSPQEQYTTDGKAQGAWTDIYALGATLYHVITGAPPPESTVRYIEDTMRPAILTEGDWRKDFLAGIDRALLVRPQDRPQSIAELRPLLFGDWEPVTRSTTRRPSQPLRSQPLAGQPLSIQPLPGQSLAEQPAEVVTSQPYSHRPEEDVAPAAFIGSQPSAAAPVLPASSAFRASVLAGLVGISLLGAYKLGWIPPRNHADVSASANSTGANSTTPAIGQPGVATPGVATPGNIAIDTTTSTAAPPRRPEPARADTEDARRAQERADLQRQAEDLSRRAADALREGVRFATGNGVPVDHARALPLFETAAQAGRVEAMNWLGRLYAGGLGVNQDFTAALDWFTRAAKAGDTASMAQLGQMYLRGQGVAQDYLMAREWFQRAADNGNVESVYGLGLLHYRGQGVAQDAAKAREYFERAGQTGHVQSMLNLAIAYKNGQGGPVDIVKAIQWYEMAAAADNPAAMNALGVIYHNGEGVAKDPVKAKSWYEKAIAGGNTLAMVNLARILNRGNGVPADPKRAATLLLSALRANNDLATQEFAVNLSKFTRETRTEVKRELQRLGHYKGIINDVWDAPAKVAADAYRARAN